MENHVAFCAGIYQAVLDLGSPELEASRVHACREEVAENLRLLYVALTRVHQALEDCIRRRRQGEVTRD